MKVTFNNLCEILLCITQTRNKDQRQERHYVDQLGKHKMRTSVSKPLLLDKSIHVLIPPLYPLIM